MHASESDPDLFIAAFRIVREVDRENLRPLLVRQSQQTLYAVEFREVFALVQKDFAVGVVDDRLLDDGRRDDVVHLLRHHHRLPEILSDSLEKVQNVGGHIGGHQ